MRSRKLQLPRLRDQSSKGGPSLRLQPGSLDLERRMASLSFQHGLNRPQATPQSQKRRVWSPKGSGLSGTVPGTRKFMLTVLTASKPRHRRAASTTTSSSSHSLQTQPQPQPPPPPGCHRKQPAQTATATATATAHNHCQVHAHTSSPAATIPAQQHQQQQKQQQQPQQQKHSKLPLLLPLPVLAPSLPQPLLPL